MLTEAPPTEGLKPDAIRSLLARAAANPGSEWPYIVGALGFEAGMSAREQADLLAASSDVRNRAASAAWVRDYDARRAAAEVGA